MKQTVDRTKPGMTRGSDIELELIYKALLVIVASKFQFFSTLTPILECRIYSIANILLMTENKRLSDNEPANAATVL